MGVFIPLCWAHGLTILLNIISMFLIVQRDPGLSTVDDSFVLLVDEFHYRQRSDQAQSLEHERLGQHYSV